MQNRENICKFINNAPTGVIKISNFVYETNNDILNKTNTKQTNMVFLIVSGSGVLTSQNQTHKISSGHLFFIFSGTPFKIESDNNLKFMYISFSGDRTDELFKRYSINSQNFIFDDNEGLISFWQSAITRASETNLDLISESVLLYTFSQLTPPEKSKEQHLADSILSYIDSNFSDFNLNLSSIADKFGYNSKYISRVFRQSTGTTFSNYLKHTRLKHAIFLMEQGLTSVKNIALLSGYNDPLYFSNVFKKEIGIPASEYIKQNKK